MVHQETAAEFQKNRGEGIDVVNVTNLAKRYSGWSLRGRKPINALRGVDLRASGGEVFGLLGPNGAGKTTLIKVLLGVVKPTSGDATLFGEPVGSAEARRRVGYLPEALRIDMHHTARSALFYYGRLSGMDRQAIRRRADELLELVGLGDRDREPVSRFSKGMYQRLGLAQALINDPDLLILDEPTDGLDPVGRNEVRRVIDTLREQGKTIFLNSHILQEVEMVCTRVAILAKGKIRGVGTVRELSQSLSSETIHLDLSGKDPMDWGHLKAKFASQLSLDVNSFDLAELDHGRHRLSVQLPSQDQLDQLVDVLRGERVSIQGIEKKRASLEELFMQLVQEQGDAEG